MLGKNEDLFSALNLDPAMSEGFDFDAMDLDLGADPLGLNDDAPPSFARVRYHQPPRFAKYDNALTAARAIGPLEAGERVDMIVSGNFIAGDLIEAYLDVNDLTATEIIIGTLSLSRENVDSLVNVKRRLTGRMGLIVSDYFFAYERKKGIEDLIQHLGGADFFLAVAGIHVKLTLIRTACGRSIVIGGSANLRSSLNIEQITIENNAAVYDFHREWMSQILNKYYVTHKMLRRETLWQLVAKAGAANAPAAAGARPN
jgi:hypothetical protein